MSSISKVPNDNNVSISVIKEGYLEKESKYMKTFRKRWIVLTSNNKLYSYKQQQIYSNHTEMFDLNSCNDVKVSNKNTNQFILIFNHNKQRIFGANSINGRDKWIKCIQKYVLKYNVNDTKITYNEQTHNQGDSKFLSVYEQHINMGFDKELALEASNKHKNDINTRISYVTTKNEQNRNTDSKIEGEKDSNATVCIESEYMLNKLLKVIDENNDNVNLYQEITNLYGNKNSINDFICDYDKYLKNIDVHRFYLKYNKQCNILNCNVIKREYRNKSEFDKNKEKRFKLYHCKNEKDIVLQQILDQIHIIKHHSVDLGYRLNRNDNNNMNLINMRDSLRQKRQIFNKIRQDTHENTNTPV
eukprot:530761_1